MKLRFVYVILCFLALSTTVRAQEENPFISYDVPSQNLLKFNRFLINPTFSTVREDKSYINLLHRNQSVSFDNNNQTYLFGYQGKSADRSGPVRSSGPGAGSGSGPAPKRPARKWAHPTAATRGREAVTSPAPTSSACRSNTRPRLDPERGEYRSCRRDPEPRRNVLAEHRTQAGGDEPRTRREDDGVDATPALVDGELFVVNSQFDRQGGTPELPFEVVRIEIP